MAQSMWFHLKNFCMSLFLVSAHFSSVWVMLDKNCFICTICKTHQAQKGQILSQKFDKVGRLSLQKIINLMDFCVSLCVSLFFISLCVLELAEHSFILFVSITLWCALCSRQCQSLWNREFLLLSREFLSFFILGFAVKLGKILKYQIPLNWNRMVGIFN